MYQYEISLIEKGFRYVAGVDEVGRGPLAGPFVVAAVLYDLHNIINDVQNPKICEKLDGIKDSKKLLEKNRLKYNEIIINECISYSVVEIDNDELDVCGVGIATKELFSKAVKSLSRVPDFVLTDAFKVCDLGDDIQLNITNGDEKSVTIASASIVAKVHRDKFMVLMHEKYPNYGFNKNMGYGTREHIEAVQKHGICPLHRKSFDPIKTFLAQKKIPADIAV